MSRSPRLLIVDDEETVLHLLTEFFTSRGYVVCSADEEANCLAALDEFPDVRAVLLDLSVGGTDLLRQIKEKRPDIEVIMMTGHDDEALAKRSISLGAFDHLAKPFDLPMLEKLVRACIDR
ncbi:MAG TPA: response regulator [Terriglobia bacterium]|nr:response regulator [Terriglobia bacterium]